MGSSRIDRLTLRLAGLGPSEARRLGERVARGLGEAGLASHRPLAIDQLRVVLPRSDDAVDGLAERIVDAILARLRNST